MPRLTVWMVRTALLELGIGFTLGMWMLFNKGVLIDPYAFALLGAHIEIMLLGWTIQLALGVAFWILPRFPQPPRYGRERLGWLGYGLINGGVLLVVLDTWISLNWLPFAGRALELAGVISFAILIWPRVKAYGQTLA